jgi:hypothetical protein
MSNLRRRTTNYRNAIYDIYERAKPLVERSRTLAPRARKQLLDLLEELKKTDGPGRLAKRELEGVTGGL